MTELIALTIFAPQMQTMLTQTDALTIQLIQDVMMDLDAPEMFATQAQKMPLMVAPICQSIPSVMMKPHVLMMLASQEMKMLTKTDACLLPTMITATTTLTAQTTCVLQAVPIPTAEDACTSQ